MRADVLKLVRVDTATVAADAFVSLEQPLGLRPPRFGVVAPHTPQRTSLGEERRADAWAVVDGVALYIENNHFVRVRVILCAKIAEKVFVAKHFCFFLLFYYYLCACI